MGVDDNHIVPENTLKCPLNIPSLECEEKWYIKFQINQFQ